MNLLPKTHDEFSQKEYWDSFFKKRGSKAFEWYGEYFQLSEQLHKYIKQQDEILITGCGNSTLGRDLYDVGCRNVTNIDVSQVVIRQMLSQNEKERPQLRFLQMDALSMTFEDDKFNCVLDKGTLDALMPNTELDVLSRIDKYFMEIQRVLKAAGRYICISLLQEHVLKILLEYFPKNNFMLRIVRCLEAESAENSMPVFLVICTKFKSLPRKILEMNLGTSNKMQRFERDEEIVTEIKNVQNAAFVCSSIKKSNIPDNEISLDLHRSGDASPRFKMYIVDIKHDSKNALYAAFIVPQGREAEWLFSTKSGRQHLAKVTKTNRLAIITMQRGHSFGTFSDVQKELNEAVCDLAPANLRNTKIQYLSLGADVGNRVVRYEGTSKFSGPYVVEDVEINKSKFRRLFYMNSQLVIQSEAKLKTVKTRKEANKEVVDLSHLTCRYHVYMSVGLHLATAKKQRNEILVVGLGGGGLCSFLNKFLPKVKIKAVDIDPEMLEVAGKWFGLNTNDRLSVTIQDGIEYVYEAAACGANLDALVFDVDNKDSTIGMSCPPKHFLEESVLSNVCKLIGGTGFFILNLVLREANLRPSIVTDLKKKFTTVISYKLAEDLNEILICTMTKLSEENIKKALEDGAREINSFFRKHQVCDSNVEIDEYLSNLKVF